MFSYHQLYDQIRGLKSEEAVLPDRADPPVPSQVNISKLAGSYYDAGYGKMTLKEESDPEKPESKILVAERLDVWLRYRLRLHHVSGDWWVCVLSLLENTAFNLAFPADFRIGANGEVLAINIEFKNDMVGMDEGAVLFERLK